MFSALFEWSLACLYTSFMCLWLVRVWSMFAGSHRFLWWCSMLLACYAMILRHSAIIAKSDENISSFFYLPPDLDIVYFQHIIYLFLPVSILCIWRRFNILIVGHTTIISKPDEINVPCSNDCTTYYLSVPSSQLFLKYLMYVFFCVALYQLC